MGFTLPRFVWISFVAMSIVMAIRADDVWNVIYWLAFGVLAATIFGDKFWDRNTKKQKRLFGVGTILPLAVMGVVCLFMDSTAEVILGIACLSFFVWFAVIEYKANWA